MSKVTVGIYPFDESFIPVIRYKELKKKAHMQGNIMK